MFLVVECRRLASGADGHESIDVTLELMGDERFEIFVRDGTLAQWCGQRCENA